MVSSLNRVKGANLGSQLISWEIGTFFMACALGMFLALEYDCIRILRRVFRHKGILLMSIEDIVYWINVSIVVFCFTYEYSDGVLRGFLVLSLLLGAWLYRYAFSRCFVKYVSMVITFLLKPLKKAFSFIKIKMSRLIRNLTSKRIKRVKGDKKNGLQQVEKEI